MTKKKEFIVEVKRDSDGQVYSQVRRNTEKVMGDKRLVVDRHRGKQFDIPVIRSRAQTLADILDAKYHEDLSWHCQAHLKLACRCPDCIKAGRA